MKTVVFRPEVEDDLRLAWGWYEAERPGLGEELLAAIRDRLASIAEGPRHFARVHRTVRRALVRTFPFAVYFVDEPNRVVVLAIQHTARDPSLWRTRSKK